MNPSIHLKQYAARIAGTFAQWWKLAGAMVLIAAVLAVALLELLGPTPVTAVHPQRAPLVAEVFGIGPLEAKVMVSFSAKTVDKVVEVLVDQGDTVTEGQVLARLEATDYEHSVQVTEAGVSQAQLNWPKRGWTSHGNARCSGPPSSPIRNSTAPRPRTGLPRPSSRTPRHNWVSPAPVSPTR